LQQTVSAAVSSHVNESNKHREVNVNTSTYESTTEIEESTVTRELENINVSRTLNYVFRQLLQEMHSVLWLKNIKFCFTNGLPGSYEETYSVGLDDFLVKHIVLADRQSVLESLLKVAGFIFNYQQNPIQFFDCKNFVTPKIVCGAPCVGRPDIPGTEACLYVKKANLTDTYIDPNAAIDPFTITVPGVVLSGTKHIMRTNSLIVDSLLGQGEALDCYNMNLQEQGIKREILNNDRLQQQLDINTQAMDIIANLATFEDKAANYKKVFGDCCDSPQGCGCNGNNPAPVVP
jgi:hypothetical protein